MLLHHITPDPSEVTFFACVFGPGLFVDPAHIVKVVEGVSCMSMFWTLVFSDGPQEVVLVFLPDANVSNKIDNIELISRENLQSEVLIAP